MSTETTTSAAAPIIQIEFKRRAKFTSLGGGLYKRDGAYWERPKIGRVRTIRKLDARTERAARLELAKKRSDQALSARGLATNPYQRVTEKLTVADLAKGYKEAGCPKRNGRPREGEQLKYEIARIDRLLGYFGRKPWNTLSPDDYSAYFKFRSSAVKRAGCNGERSVDMEFHTLAAILRWARRHPNRTGVTADPLAGDRPRFRDAEKVRHCRDVQPASGDELHRLAAALFQEPKSQALGWQLLFEAMVGQRTNEILELRWDAKARGEAGFIEGNLLYLHHKRGHKGTYPFITIHSALDQLITELRSWREERFPDSPWFFPSHIDQGEKPVHKTSLTKALERICPALKIPLRTSHGLRSFYVNVLRSRRHADGTPKLSDAEIALRIGHKTGGRLIVDVYGEISPDRLSWMPAHKEDAAWNIFKRTRPVQLELGI